MKIERTKVMLISSGQPSANPRLVKEAVSLFYNGYQVKVIYCPLSPWADEFDQELFAKYDSIEWIQAGTHPVKEKRSYFFARLRVKFFDLMFRLFGQRFDADIKSLVLYGQELIQIAKKNKADLYIGHNLGALPAVVKAAKFYGAKAGFDFEDFHRGEAEEGSPEMMKTRMIEEKYVAMLDYFSAASPLIEKAYNQLFPAIPSLTINNCFPSAYAVSEIKEPDSRVLKLFWFSQTIGKKRGLEIVLQAMSLLEKNIVTLTLLGNCTVEMKMYFTALTQQLNLAPEQLIFVSPVKEGELVEIAAAHHIGIATELPHIANRELCLTNKLFIYLLAGNAILFSNTKAQEHFFNNYPTVGSLFDAENVQALKKVLENYILNPHLLHAQRKQALKLGKEKMNWDEEQLVFLNNIEKLLQH